MALSVDWAGKVVNSTASIDDLPSFKEEIRLLEEGDAGMLYPPILTYKRVDLGSGAYFHAVDFINGYKLRFPNAGSYSILGNLNAEIVPVSGVYVERKTAAAFATTDSGGTGSTLTAAQVRIEMDTNSQMMQLITLAQKLLRNKAVTDPATGKLTVYDDDGTTVLVQGDLFEDAAGTTPYSGNGSEHRGRLA